MTHLLNPKTENPFHCAANGDVDFFKTVVPEILLQARDEDDNTVLTVAAKRGHLDCCEVIVERCTPLLYHQDNRFKLSVLYFVIAYDWWYIPLENIMRFLITADSKPDLELGGGAKLPNKRLLTMQDCRGMTALHLAVGYQNLWATKLLLEADRDFELLRMVDDDGETCLHIAVRKDDAAAELIIKSRPDNEFLKMTDSRSNQTALHIAVEKKNIAIVQMLLEAGNCNDLMAVVDSHQRTALHYAVEQGNLNMVKLMCKVGLDKQLLGMPNEDKNTTLHLAARDGSGSDSLAKLLLEKDPIQRTKLTGDIACAPLLHFAASCGFNSVVMDIIRLCPECINTVDFHGQNFLHKAAYHLDMVKYFLESKDIDVVALLNTQDKDGNTPLHLAISKSAASCGFNSVVMDIIRLFPECINTVDFHGQNVLHKAAYHGHLDVVKHFLESKDIDVIALLNTQDKDGNMPLHLVVSKAAQDGFSSDSENIFKLLLTRNPSVCTKQTGDMKWTPLHYAISYGLYSFAKGIIRLCPDCVKVEDSDGKTPYMIATRRILSDERRECLDSEIICMLLEKDPQQCRKLEDKHEQPFIHVAVKRGLTDVVKKILKWKGIEDIILNIQDKDGNTPLHIAALSPNEDMTLCLLYDARVSKRIRNNKLEYAIDLINFTYDEEKVNDYIIGHQSDLKDQSSFDLLVAVLIATVSFTAGITVPGGYVSDGANKGSAILLKATAFKVFVVSNNFALLFSLFSVVLKFSSRRLFKEENIYYDLEMGTYRTRLLLKKKDMMNQLNAATLCNLSAVYAMVISFITGSYAVLAKSDGLAITVCVSSSIFLILVSYAMWTMARQYWHLGRKPTQEKES